MKRFWNPGMGRTVLFSVAVVAFVIGTYQTLLESKPGSNLEGLHRNYWLFMVSLACTMGYRYLVQRDKEKEAAKAASAFKSVAKPAKNTPRNKRRR